MNITSFAIKRPAAMSMIVLCFVVLGLFSYTKISSDLFPRTNTPFVTVVTIYPGAGPEEIESEVMKTLEEAISPISGIRKIHSTASEGRLIMILEFSMSSDADIAAIDTQKAVDAVQHKLPRGVEKPIIHKYDLNAQPIMLLAVAAPRSPAELNQLAEEIKAEIEGTDGVAEVAISGGRKRQIHIHVDKHKLELHGLSLNQVINRLYMENFNIPSGRLEQPGTEYNIRVLGQFTSLEEVENLLLPLPQGGTVNLKEVAQVKDSLSELRQFHRLNGRDAVGIIIQKQSDASIVDTAARLTARVNSLQQQLPDDAELIVVADESDFIHSSLSETKRSLLEGIITTGLVLFIFLWEWRSFVIVMLAIPTSIIATFLMMFFMGYSFNVLSLLGLTVCVGILVDDSIVVIENIHRHLKMGKSPAQAALDGRNEVGFAAVAITLSDVVVFAPIAFMSGMVGQFFRQFGLTVVFATLFSLFVSFTLTPMLAAKMLKSEGETKETPRQKSLAGLLLGKTMPFGRKIREFYRHSLEFILSNRWKVVLLTFLLFVGSLSLIPLGLISTEFMTVPDQGEVIVNLELAPGTAQVKTDEVIRELEEEIAKLPEVRSLYTTVGTGNTGFISAYGSYLGEIKVLLVPKEQRNRTQWEVADSLRELGTRYPGIKITAKVKGTIGRADMSPLILEVTGTDQDRLIALAHEVEQLMSNTAGVVDLQSSWREGQPEIQVQINRKKAAEYGLSVVEIARTVRIAMEGERATAFRHGGKEYDMVVKLQDFDRKSIEDIKSITVQNQAGMMVRLDQIAEIETAMGPTEIRHKNRQRLISLTANISGRPLGDITKEINAGLAQIKIPDGFKVEYYGDQKDMEESFWELVQVLILSLVLVYMILVVLYESYLTPLIRMLSLPAGAIGALVILALTGNTLNIMSFIGIIMLDGLAAKNGTLLIDYTHTLMHRGMGLKEALIESSITRLRPIFMTSVTMIFGVLPTALAMTEGSEYRTGMALVIIGGMITSFIFTPVIIPVAYTLLDDFKKMWRGLTKEAVEKIG